MKLIKALRNLEAQIPFKLPSNETFRLLFIPLTTLCLTAAIIWFAGPSLSWEGFAPLASTEKRIYLIAFIFLAWLLKFLMIDLDAPNPFQYKDMKVRKKILELQKRFQGASKFINSATTTKQGKTISLNKLPWYLLIGPSNAGKTTLLANSDVHYILQRHFPHNPLPSEHLDWWVTREASIIDVPGKYLSGNRAVKNANQDANIFPHAWQFFLRLIKKQRGKHGINGIIIALPAPEIIKQNDTKQYNALLKNIFQRIYDVQKNFPYQIPCQIVITKCDLLSGFSEFFSESNSEELSQAWGINLPELKKDEKLANIFSTRFDALIKKINQQLLWRLHQERNPMLRPYIKDFPLQVERVKEFMQDFCNKITSTHLNVSIQGVYLTSALQIRAANEGSIIDHAINSTSRDLQIFKEPNNTSRAYFIKQFLIHGLGATQAEPTPISQTMRWIRRSIYATSVSIITLTIVLFGLDFQRGLEQTHLIKSDLAEYQANLAKIHNPSEHLIETIRLLNNLKPISAKDEATNSVFSVLSFYSRMSQQKTRELYQQALHNVLAPEIKNYFENYISTPVNQNAEDIYAVLKAYLMMGDATYFDSDYIITTIKRALPSTFTLDQKNHLNDHLIATFNSPWIPLILDKNKIHTTRSYLMSLPGTRLSFIILKNIDNNNKISNINFLSNPVFSTSQVKKNQIPVMFTAQSYHSIISQESVLAAQEAIAGNWVLGHNDNNHNLKNVEPLTDQLRNIYIKHYIDTWENVLESIHLSSAQDLTQVDSMIVHLANNDSPLVHLLRMLHENTYFDPISSSSPKLQQLGLLVDKTATSQNLLYEIITSLQNLHLYLRPVIDSDNQRQAAFNVVSSRMLSRGKLDAITQLRMVAEKSPKPIQNWLDKIADDSWQFLITDAGHYLDTSWQTKVIHYYQAEIANRYPFDKSHDREVDIPKFIKFFGNPGIVLTYYNKYLQPFVDTSTYEWHWKKIENKVLPFSEETLRQIQQAMRIHHSFFPKNDNKLLVQFKLQPYQFGDFIQSVRLNINNNQFIDNKNSYNNTHIITWPNNSENRMTSIQLTMTNQNTVRSTFPGNWGWFKLLNQSFESMITKKEMLINLSMNQHPAKYVLAGEGQYNPYLGLNLTHFHLPQSLTDEKM